MNPYVQADAHTVKWTTSALMQSLIYLAWAGHAHSRAVCEGRYPRTKCSGAASHAQSLLARGVDVSHVLHTCVRLRFARPRGLNAARGFGGGASSAAMPVSFSSAILHSQQGCFVPGIETLRSDWVPRVLIRIMRQDWCCACLSYPKSSGRTLRGCGQSARASAARTRSPGCRRRLPELAHVAG